MEIKLGIQGNHSAESREKEVATPTGGERGKPPGRKDEAASPGNQVTDTWGPGWGRARTLANVGLDSEALGNQGSERTSGGTARVRPGFFFFLIIIYLFIFDCVGSSLLCEGSL